MTDRGVTGDPGYREFATARATQLFRIAFLICGDWHEAEDLVQITLAKLFVAWHRVLRPAGALPISCTMRALSDGGTERDAVMYADEFGFYGYNIYDERPDQVTMFIQVANGTNHYLPHVDRATPPGSMAEWAALAQNPA